MSFWRAIKLLLTLHCEESARLQSEALERNLTGVERWAVRLHFLSCRACRNFKRQLRFIQEAARRQSARTEGASLPPDVHDKILRNLGESNDTTG